jgi:Zn-dependent protease with chaperone function
VSAEAWDVLVRRLEQHAKQEPRTYRVRVAALATLGYVVLGGVVALLAAAVVGTIYVGLDHPVLLKFLLPIGALVVIVVRSFPFRLDPPQGLPLARERAPQLFDEVEQLARTIGAPRLHSVLVDDDLNASVSQTPRFGPLGPSRNVLVLGLPLLQALSTTELRAVLAHELGHVSGRHGRFGVRVYRVRQTWMRLLAQLEHNGHVAAGPLRRFFRWYAPYFGAYTFVLAREHEYDADAAAAAATSADAAAAALVRLAIVHEQLSQTFWPEVYRGVEQESRPTARPFSTLPGAVRSFEVDDAERRAAAALAATTGTADTHPSLSDRLAALGVAPDDALRAASAAPASSAADELLGASASELAEQLDATWRNDVAEAWAAAHKETRAARARLDHFATHPPTDGDGLLEHAQLVEQFEGEQAALEHYRTALAATPNDPVANFGLGRILLAADDDAGIAHIEAAMDADPDAILPGCELIGTYLTRNGRSTELATYHARAEQRSWQLEDAFDERQTLRQDDSLAAHDLPAGAVAAITERLTAFPLVHRAYLGRRLNTHLDDELPTYVLGVEAKLPTFKLQVRDPRAGLVHELAAALNLPLELFVVDLAEHRTLKRTLRNLDASLIYERRAPKA